MTTALILNIAFSAVVFSAVLGLILWSIATQRRDRGHVLVRRAGRHRWAHALMRPATTSYREQPWPAA